MASVRCPLDKSAARRRQACAVLLGASVLAGCSNGRGTFASATDVFHGLEGGVIAQQRPPPPGADDPWPNLGQVPPRPAAPDIAAQQRIEDTLAAQRDAADANARANPIPVAPPPPPPTPKPAAADPNANKVVVDAAPAPPAPPPPPATPAPAPAKPDIPGLGAVPAVPAQAATGPVPSLAAAPPPIPSGVGLDVPATPVGGWPTVAPETIKAPANTVAVAFTPGSDQLPPSATLNLRRFALSHKGVKVTVTGRGGDVLPGVDAQGRALDLALRRAQAIAASLATAGVPAANLLLRAEAAGQGGSASL